VDTRHIACGDGPGGHAIIQVSDGGENAIVLFGGANREIAEAAIDAALAEARPGDLFLTQNETSGVAHGLRRARESGLSVCLNPAPFGPEVLEYPLDGVDLFVVNETEAAGLLGATAWSDDGLERLAARFPRAAWVVTLGARGALCRTAAGQTLQAPASPVHVVDTTAAGDTFIGYFLACCQKGLGLERALRLANRAAGVCVGRPGAADSIPAWAELGEAPVTGGRRGRRKETP
jgi:ribokinase